MADSATTIGTLEYKVEASASSAISALDKLERKLLSVSSVLDGIAAKGSSFQGIVKAAQALDRMGKSASNVNRQKKDINNKPVAPKTDTRDLEKMAALLDDIRTKMQMSNFVGQKNPFGAVTQDMSKQLPAIRKTYTDYMKFLPALYKPMGSQLPVATDIVPKRMDAVLGAVSANMGENLSGQMNVADAVLQRMQETEKQLPAIRQTYTDFMKFLPAIPRSLEDITKSSGESKPIAEAIDAEWREIGDDVSRAAAAANQFKDASSRGLFGTRHIDRSGWPRASETFGKGGLSWTAQQREEMMEHFRNTPGLEQFIQTGKNWKGEERTGVKASIAYAEMKRVHKQAEEAAKKQAEAEKEVAKEADGAAESVKEVGSASESSHRKSKGLLQGLAESLKGVARLFSKFGKAVGKIFGGHSGHRGILGNRSLGQFIGLIVFRRLITSALRALTSGIKEGSDNLTQYSASYNAAISGITSSLNFLKNAWAAGFAPIVEVVAPYLQAFVDMIANALNAIGRFLAAVTGKGFAVQAVKVFSDYAKGLKSTGSAASGANKALDEYKKTILSFDELHVLNDVNDRASGGGGGGGGGNGNTTPISDMFTTVEVESAGMTDLLNRAMEGIDWDAIQAKAKATAERIGNAINEFVEGLDWELLGNTIGSGIQTAFDFVNTFLDTVHFDEIGTAIGEFVNGLNDKFRLEGVGDLLASRLNAIADLINNFALTVHWDEIGTNIREGITKFIDEFDAEKMGTAVENFLDGIDEMLGSITSDPSKFEEFGRKIGTMLSNVNWTEHLSAVASAIWTAVTSLLRGLVDTKAGSFIVTIAGLLTVSKLAPLGEAVAAIFRTKLFKSSVSQAITEAIKEAAGGGAAGAAGATGAAGTGVMGLLGGAVAGIAAAALVSIIGGHKDKQGIEKHREIDKTFTEADAWARYEGMTPAERKAEANKILAEDRQRWTDQNLWYATNGAMGEYTSAEKNGLYTAEKKLAKQMALGTQGLGKLGHGSKGEVNELAYALLHGTRLDFGVGRNVAAPMYRASVQISMSKHSKANAMLYKESKQNGKGTATVAAKADFGFYDLSQTFTSMKDKIATVTAQGRTSSSYTGLEQSYSSGVWTKYDKVVKTLEGATSKSYTDHETKFKNFGKDHFDAVKTIKGAIAQSFTNTESIYNKLAEKEVKATAKAEDQNGTVNKVATAYAKLFDKNVSVKASGTMTVNDVVYAQKAVRSIQAGFNNIFGTARANGGIFSGGRWHDITRYAMGGYPNESGQLFIAREAGPELVGTIGGHTAVMNNDQIVASVAAGVYNAVVRANAMNGQSKVYIPGEITLRTENNEVLARAVMDGEASLGYRR